MASRTHGIRQDLLVVVARTLPPADGRAATHDLLEGVRIGEIPSLHVWIGASRNDHVLETLFGRAKDLVPFLAEGDAISVDAHNNEIGRCLHAFLNESLKELELVDGASMAATRREHAHLCRNILLSCNPKKEGFEEFLVGPILNEEGYDTRLTHRGALAA